MTPRGHLVVNADDLGWSSGVNRGIFDTLFTVLAPAQQIAKFDRLRAIQRIDSKLAGVTPAQIRIVVKAQGGDIAVPVAADGRIQFPLDETLRAQNPDVQTNQPKGSLSLTVTMELKLPDSLHIGWDDLHEALTHIADGLGLTAYGLPCDDSPIRPWSRDEFEYVIREAGGVLAYKLL